MLTLLTLLACNPEPAKPVVEPIQVQPGVTCYVAISGTKTVGLSCIGMPQPQPQPPVPPNPPLAGTEAPAAEAATEEKKAE